MKHLILMTLLTVTLTLPPKPPPTWCGVCMWWSQHGSGITALPR